MDHWVSNMPPGRIFEVRYEDMIYDQEGTSRAVLSHVGVPWEDAVLKFHDTDRYVNTMSAAQVSEWLAGWQAGRLAK
jgi:hypothetical protein